MNKLPGNLRPGPWPRGRDAHCPEPVPWTGRWPSECHLEMPYGVRLGSQYVVLGSISTLAWDTVGVADPFPRGSYDDIGPREA